MPKISIYVPDDMKARMDVAEARANWSAIAQRAFGVELNHLESVREVKSMSDVIERLQASKQKFAEKEMAHAKERGVEWAKTTAEFDQLRKMAMVDTVGLDLDLGVNSATLVYELVMGIELGPDPSDFEDLASFFLIDYDLVRTMSPEYVEGFVDGAKAIWNEVEDQV